jgi:RNA polymerase sigma-70 factor (ECF subfamily)
MLEKLTPAERAAYILREAFDYAYRDIARILQLGEANARQLVTRARQHVVGDRARPSDSAEQRHLLAALVAATRQGDIAALECLLVSSIVSSPPVTTGFGVWS